MYTYYIFAVLLQLQTRLVVPIRSIQVKAVLTFSSLFQLELSFDYFLPTSLSTLEGGQSAVPVAHSQEQDHYWPQDHRGAEGVVHSSEGGCLPVRPHCLLLASVC